MSRKTIFISIFLLFSFILFGFNEFNTQVLSYINSRQISERSVTSSGIYCDVLGGFPIAETVRDFKSSGCGSDQIKDYGPFESQETKLQNFWIIYFFSELLLIIVIYTFYKRADKRENTRD